MISTSISESSRKLLIESVLDTNTKGCALARLKEHTGNPCIYYEDVAVQNGISIFQARGIMDGWDSNTKIPCFTDSSNEPGYPEGFSFGQELWKMILPSYHEAMNGG